MGLCSTLQLIRMSLMLFFKSEVWAEFSFLTQTWRSVSPCRVAYSWGDSDSSLLLASLCPFVLLD